MNNHKSIDLPNLSPPKSLSRCLHSQSSKVVAGLVMGLGITLAALPADALSYVTNINFTNYITIGTDNIGSVRMNWSTNLSSGVVTENNLTDWSISLILTNGSTLYTDNVIIGGAVQNIRNQTRTISNIDFSFDFNSDILYPFANDSFPTPVQAAGTGLGYHIFSTGSSENISVFIVKYDSSSSSNEGGTDQNTQPIPFEFSPTWGLFLLGISYGIRKRLNNQ